MALLILLRHGSSIWNDENKFTGSINIDLSSTGEKEARVAGRQLKIYNISYVFCSKLKRAIRTAEIVLKYAEQGNYVLRKNAALNERNYGVLQGLNKCDAMKQYGAEQVQLWRRGYSECPPNGESLQETSRRVLNYYNTSIKPLGKLNNIILIVAHSNSLRVLMNELEQRDGLNGIESEIQNCAPMFYKLSN